VEREVYSFWGQCQCHTNRMLGCVAMQYCDPRRVFGVCGVQTPFQTLLHRLQTGQPGLFLLDKQCTVLQIFYDTNAVQIKKSVIVNSVDVFVQDILYFFFFY
jgi:hypothetical protein